MGSNPIIRSNIGLFAVGEGRGLSNHEDGFESRIGRQISVCEGFRVQGVNAVILDAYFIG